MEQNKLLENPEDIRLNDNLDLQQILGSPPGWILRWGITVVFFAIMILGLISYVVKYPDTIEARVALTTEQPPIRVVAKINGKIESLNVKDKLEVKTGDVLAVIENPADQHDIERLDQFVTSLQDYAAGANFRELTIPRNLKLGSLQNEYANFVNKVDNYKFYLKNNITSQKVANLEKQNSFLDNLNLAIKAKMETQKDIVENARVELVRAESMIDFGGISEAELEPYKTNHLEKKKVLEDLKISILSNEGQIQKNKMQILDIRQLYTDNTNKGVIDIKEDVERMRNGIETWIQNFLIKAPISGKVSLSEFWSAQQYINANEELLTIVPTNNSGKVIGKAILPLARSGKVEPMMKANIRLDGFPYQEFGSLESTVADIALVPQDNAYQLILNIPPDLITTYGKEIPFRQEMQGTAKIITEDRRIIERIFDKILSILKNR